MWRRHGLGMMKLPPLKKARGTGLLFQGCPRHMWKTFFKSASVSKAILDTKKSEKRSQLLVKWEPKRNSTWTRPKSAAAPFGPHAFGILSLGGDI